MPGFSVSWDFWCAHVFGPKPNPNQPSWHAAQNRKNGKELEKHRRRRRPVAFQHAADDPFLDRELQPLREAHRQRAPVLYGLKILVAYLSS
jgi:hypothetical protein